jgi:tRNA U34 2-thiouridine synthase MnmA/TrmU
MAKLTYITIDPSKLSKKQKAAYDKRAKVAKELQAATREFEATFTSEHATKIHEYAVAKYGADFTTAGDALCWSYRFGKLSAFFGKARSAGGTTEDDFSF